jgi:lipopolysaccharide/colanic/teichoic acid biosynthesis glycosyltransferase
LLTRPGITGGATIVFAREAALLAAIPSAELELCYRDLVLPLKEKLDGQYMSRATLLSDAKLILRSVFRKWNDQDSPEFDRNCGPSVLRNSIFS